MERLETDILILGSGGAGLLAALHAHEADPDLDITVAVKGLMGKCGCTRMVQGGYNAAIDPSDSIERHFMDTIRGGSWLPNQELAWRLVSSAPARVLELENRHGCFFDRNPDGTLHGKAFAGQTFDRTIHKGDQTGIEIVNRLMEQVLARPIRRLEEHRAVALVPARDGGRIAGVVLLEMKTGALRYVAARAVLLGTGGGPTMYRYHTPSGDKACDGMAMALRAGLDLRDMEMVQFHPTGLLAGEDTRLTGTVLEEGLRGAGGHMLNGEEKRFMLDYDERAERATRDLDSRAIFDQIRKGLTSPAGGVYISMAALEPEAVRRQFKGMVERCADVGFDLAAGLVEVVPTAHYMMGGVEVGLDCETDLAGLFCAGEDAGGVHGANRLGGNGVANSTVFGGIAGEVMARWLAREGRGGPAPADEGAIEAARARVELPFGQPAGDLNSIRLGLLDLMWDEAGIIRDAAGLARARDGLARLRRELDATGLADDLRAYNLTWHDWLNLDSQIEVSGAIVAAALARENSRGAHFREDFPDAGPLEASSYTRVRLADAGPVTENVAVEFTRVRPGKSLIAEEMAAE